MLPKKHRLLAEKDFSRLFKTGRVFSGRDLGLKAGKNGLGVTRVGFAVGVKTAKRAVDRNRLKRRLREIVRKRLPDIVPGHDLIFLARIGAVKLSFLELEEAVSALLSRAGLLLPRR